jgi:glycosyltransferase involved in cell wall biosynthesis
MNADVYRKRAGLVVDVQSNGWAHVRLTEGQTGVALDPPLFAVWSAADGHTLGDIAQSTRLSTYLVSCALAVLRCAGLLQDDERVALSQPSDPVATGAKSSVSAVIVHRHPQTDLDRCVASVLGQGYPNLVEIKAVAAVPVALQAEGVHLIQCDTPSLVHSLAEQLAQAAGEAILVLDSQASLTPGGLAEMVYALELRSDIAAVAPRVMWHQWPAFVVQVGDWRDASGSPPNPYAGHLDVGQFERWREVPAIGWTGGLLSREAIQQVGLPDGEHDFEGIMAEWCHQVRLWGYHILAAMQAVVRGPWSESPGSARGVQGRAQPVVRDPEPGRARAWSRTSWRYERLRLSGRQTGWLRGWATFHSSRVEPSRIRRSPRSDGQLDALIVPGPSPMLHDGQPSLTVDNVRGVYGQCPAVAPLPIRPRVVFLGQQTTRHQGMARQLSETCEVGWVVPAGDDLESLDRVCGTADLVITTAEPLQRFKFLQYWHRPILADMQPPVTFSRRVGASSEGALDEQVRGFLERPQHWLQTVDGVICASEEERLYWLGQLAAVDRLNPYVRLADPALRDLVMVVPTGVEPDDPPADPVLKGVRPDVDAGDKVVLWCGGLRPFDDPLTAIRALAGLRSLRGDVKLVFAAFDDQEHDAARLHSASRLASELGLSAAVIFDERVPAHKRGGYLAEADLGLVLGTDSLEAQLHEPVELSACIGAGLPLVVVSGHAGSGLVQRYGLGETVPACDVGAVSRVLAEGIQVPRDTYRARFAAAQEELSWSRAMKPLVRFCQQPRYAPDWLVESLFPQALTPEPTSLWLLPGKARQMLRQRGLADTAREVQQYIRWKMRG